MLRYAITNRAQYSGTPAYRLDCLVREAALWAAEGIDYIQLREKDLEAGEQVTLTRRVMAAVREVAGDAAAKTRVLVNSRLDVAVAAVADGVHLTSAEGELTPINAREVFRRAGLGVPVVSVSCHSVDEVAQASGWGVDGILFGPVFGKVVDGVEVVPGVGLAALRKACLAAAGTPVFALGGVTIPLSGECLEAGAAGVAGIRMFLRE
jgi:thiamine-phosphate pyrophosphorylase